MSTTLQSLWGSLWSSHRSLVPFVLPATILLTSTLTVHFSADRSTASETLLLAIWATLVFTPLALLPAARRPIFAALGLAVTTLVCTLPHSGGLRPAAVASVLALTVLILAGLTFAHCPAPGVRTAAALALAAAITLHGHRLLLDGFSVRTVVLLGVFPGVAAVCAAHLAAAGRPGAGLVAALVLLAAPQLASEPWWVGLAFAAIGVPASFGSGAVATLARRGLFLFGGATLLAGGFPWLRTAPVTTLLQVAADVGRPVAETPLYEQAVVLTQTSPSFATELSGIRIRSVIIDSYLTNGVDLECGQELAGLGIVAAAETEQSPVPAPASWRAALLVGRDSAEWAAGRPDVAARLACPAPAPWISWIPAAGRFLGQTTRARFALDAPRAARSLVIERNPALPAETTLALFFVATER